MQLIPLEQPLSQVLVAPPALTAEQEAVVAASHEELMRTGGYDDPALFCRRVVGEVAQLFCVPYSWKLMIEQHPELGCGPATAFLLLQRENGDWLWTRRADKLGGWWSWSAAGGIDPGETAKVTVVREAQEELNLEAEAILDLQLLGRVEPFGYATAWSARLAPGAEVAANPHEVADVRWQRTPYDLSPLSQTLTGLRPQLEPLLGRRY